MSSLKDLQRPIKSELKEFELHFESSMKSTVPLIDRITHYIVKRKGKQVRPMLVFLSAKTIGPIRKETYVAASLIELLHTASLVHDDVVDDANMRRGFFSINAIWKNKIAVLVGDFFFSKGMLLALENEQYNALQILSQAVREMSEGELLQMDKSRKLDITEEVYYDIIRQKTASMLAASCAAGAASVTDNPEQIEALKSFGYAAGMAYQIKDDLFDYGFANVGKPTGNDIKEKKMTLPLIHALSKVEESERKHILYLVRKKSDKKDKRREIIKFVQDNHGIEYAAERMNYYKDQALMIINRFEINDSQRALSKLVEYMISREK